MPNSSSALSKNRAQAFEQLYHDRLLGEYETISGSGSTIYNTRLVRKGLQFFIDHHVKSIIDIGCGDFNWQPSMKLDAVSYTATELVNDLVESNSRKFQGSSIRFIHHDIVKSIPEKHDLVLCRDLFTHFSNQDIASAINHIIASGSTYLAATSYYPSLCKLKLREHYHDRLNHDSASGYWRPVNLGSAPFCFPIPMFRIPEAQPGKFLEIWRISDLPELTPDYFELQKNFNPTTHDDLKDCDFYKKLIALPFVEKVAFFGSRGKKTHRPDSDMDLMIFADRAVSKEEWLSVCDIVRGAKLPLSVDCMLYDESVKTIPGDYFSTFGIYRIIYDRSCSS
jgi:hypothetical protein